MEDITALLDYFKKMQRAIDNADLKLFKFRLAIIIDIWYYNYRNKKGVSIMNQNEKSIMHKELIDLLVKNIKNDEEYFSRLLYALQIISSELNYFEEEV